MGTLTNLFVQVSVSKEFCRYYSDTRLIEKKMHFISTSNVLESGNGNSICHNFECLVHMKAKGKINHVSKVYWLELINASIRSSITQIT
jgi:hypothetical protein